MPELAKGAPYAGSGPFVFMSRAKGDAALTGGLIARVQDAGVPVWYDTQFEPEGERATSERLDAHGAWQSELVDRLGNSAGVVLLLASGSAADGHCARQVSFAVKHGKPVVAVQLQECKPAGALALNLTLADNVDAAEFEDAEALARAVADACKRMIGQTEGKLT